MLYCEKVKSIVEELRADRENGAKRLENECKARLMAVALRLCADRALAEALVYRTFEEVVARLDSYTEQSAFFAWMCKILVNCHAKDTRRKSNETVVFTSVLPDAPDNGAEKVVDAVDAGILRDAIENLPPDMKEAVILRYFMDQPVAKIAQILALPIGTVKSRLHYARVLLGKRLGANLKKPAVVAAVVAALLFAATAAVVGGLRRAESANQYAGTATNESEPCALVADIGEAADGLSTGISTVNDGGDAMNAKAMRSMAAAVALGATAANAATWTNGNWSVAENWAEGVVPADGAAVTISNLTAGATFTVDVDSVSVAALTWSGKSFTLTGGLITSSGNLTANCAVTCDCDLKFTASYPCLYFHTKCTVNGDVTGTGSQLKLGGDSGGADFHGRVTAVDVQFTASAWKSPRFNFYGKVMATRLGFAQVQSSSAYLYASGNDIGTVVEDYTPVYPGCAGALAATSVVSLVNTSYATSPTFNLQNYNQTIDRILTGGDVRNCSVGPYKTGEMTYNLRSTRSNVAEPAVLKLNATADNENKVRVQDKVTIIYNPQGNYTQTFATNFAHTTSGDIIVSNGTFRVAGTSTFANVKRIVVADGATFALLTESANALAGVTNIVLGVGAHFAITNAATPFAANAVTLEMDETATFDLPDGANYLFAVVSVGGIPLDGDTYSGGGAVPQFSGSGSITVPDVEVLTVDATWTGEGETDGIAVSGNWNWDGDETPALNAKSLYPLFASGGGQATIDRALDFKGVHFGGASGRFDLVSGGDAANLTVRQLGFAVDATHTNAMDVAVKVKSGQTWTIGTDSMLEFKKPVSMDTAYAVTVAGSGATTGSVTTERITSVLRLDGDNGFLGDFSASGALVNVYSPTNAFGPASDTTVTLSDSMLYLHGGVIERPVKLNGQNNKYYWFSTWGTNVLTKMFTQTCTYWRPYFRGRIVSEGGVTVNCQVFFNGDSTAEWRVRGKPWKHTGTTSAVCQLEVHSGNIHFEVDGNLMPRLFVGASGQVHCHVDNPFNGRSAIALNMRSGSSGLHLHGHDVAFGSITDMTGGTVDSDLPGGVLRLTAQDAVITNKAVRFTGAAGFEMSGTGAVVFTNAIESAGSVAVTKGTLEFTGTGSWLDCTNVTASGTGRLKIAQSRTFSKHATLTVSDSGVVELGEGVCHKFHQAFIGGGKLEPGLYSGAEGPTSADKTYAAHFAGKGEIRVCGGGFLLVFH